MRMFLCVLCSVTSCVVELSAVVPPVTRCPVAAPSPLGPAPHPFAVTADSRAEWCAAPPLLPALLPALTLTRPAPPPPCPAPPLAARPAQSAKPGRRVVTDSAKAYDGKFDTIQRVDT